MVCAADWDIYERDYNNEDGVCNGTALIRGAVLALEMSDNRL